MKSVDKKISHPSLITPYLTVLEAEGFIKLNAFTLINCGTPCHTLSTTMQIWECSANMREKMHTVSAATHALLLISMLLETDAYIYMCEVKSFKKYILLNFIYIILRI